MCNTSANSFKLFKDPKLHSPYGLVLRLIINNYISFPLSFYDTATRLKRRGIFYRVKGIITRRKCGSGSLVLFLIRHVLFLESVFSSRKLMSLCIK